jgi:DnaJ-class molecular chaperone
MKDYYKILGVPENCSDADIRKAFRKLAFRYHPDTNPGNEKWAEEKFKEINEAYGVLGDKVKRQQYDAVRKSPFTGAGYDTGAFRYSQQDIFNGIFSNRAMFDEMNRMFAQAGLRFDQDFLNRVFFAGRGFSFQFFTSPGGAGRGFYGSQAAYQQRPYVSTHKPGWMERLLVRIVTRVAKSVLNRLLNTQYESLPKHQLDHHVTLEITPAEAMAGGEKRVTYKRSGQVKNLMVKVPSGVKTGTKIRLRGMGMTAGKKSGDLYLHVQIGDASSS